MCLQICCTLFYFYHAVHCTLSIIMYFIFTSKCSVPSSIDISPLLLLTLHAHANAQPSFHNHIMKLCSVQYTLAYPGHLHALFEPQDTELVWLASHCSFMTWISPHSMIVINTCMLTCVIVIYYTIVSCLAGSPTIYVYTKPPITS